MRISILVLVILLAWNIQFLFGQVVSTVAGDQVNVNVGSAHGVNVGMRAKVMAWEGSGEQRLEVPIANIEVIKVVETQCTAKIMAVGQGYAIQKGMRVWFADKLKSPPKTSVMTTKTISPTDDSTADGLSRRLQKMTLMEKIGYAKMLLEDEKYTEAVAAYEIIDREAPDNKPYIDDYRRAQEAWDRQLEVKQLSEAEKAEMEKIRINLDYYRTLVSSYERDGDLEKAVEYQRTICRVDKRITEIDKLEDLEYRLELSKLNSTFYPEDIQTIIVKYPKRSRELQAQAQHNAEESKQRRIEEEAAREAFAKEEAKRTENARLESERNPRMQLHDVEKTIYRWDYIEELNMWGQPPKRGTLYATNLRVYWVYQGEIKFEARWREITKVKIPSMWTLVGQTGSIHIQCSDMRKNLSSSSVALNKEIVNNLNSLLKKYK